MGIGQELDGVLGFFDGVNEHGFAAAALYFAGYAKYDNAAIRNASTIQVASYDFLTYILGHCASVEDLLTQMDTISIIGVSDPLTQTVAPLHWIAEDRTGNCVVLELTDRGAEMFHNSIGVLANSPDFRWHMTNLRNYMIPNQWYAILPSKAVKLLTGDGPIIQYRRIREELKNQ